MSFILLKIFLVISLFFSNSKNECVNSNTSVSLIQFSETLKDLPTYPYPYEHLEDSLTKQGKNSLLLFSYGSLMDKKSASLTLSPKALSTYRYAIAFGVIRLFDRDVPIKAQSKWGIPLKSEARGMLNICPVSYLEEFVNGVVMEIPLEDIKNLLSREEGYDLIPIVIADWNSFIQKKEMKFEIAYALHAPQSSVYTSSHILPRPGYYELVRNAALQGGPLFELLWYNTTYFLDKCPIYLWEKKIRMHDPETQIHSH